MMDQTEWDCKIKMLILARFYRMYSVRMPENQKICILTKLYKYRNRSRPQMLLVQASLTYYSSIENNNKNDFCIHISKDFLHEKLYANLQKVQSKFTKSQFDTLITSNHFVQEEENLSIHFNSNPKFFSKSYLNIHLTFGALSCFKHTYHCIDYFINAK